MKETLYDTLNKIEEKNWWFQARQIIVQALLRRFLPTKKQLSILDIGCGTGAMLPVLQHFGRVYGIDSNPRAIQYAQKKTKSIKISHAVFPEHAFSPETFDLVTSFDVFEHIEKDKEAMQSVADLLNKDGMFMFTVPAYNFLWCSHDDIHDHKRRYTRQDLKKKLREAGLTIVKLSYYNTFLFFPILILKFYRKTQKRKPLKAHMDSVPPWFVNAFLRTVFGLERFFLPYVKFPFGISLIGIAKKAS